MLAGRNVGPRFADGKPCAWCGTPIFKSQMPRPRGRGKWAHGGGCLGEPKAHESWSVGAQHRLEDKGVEATVVALRDEIDAYRAARYPSLLAYLKNPRCVMQPTTPRSSNWIAHYLTGTLLRWSFTPWTAGDTETVRLLQVDRYFTHFDPWDEDESILD